MSVIAWYIFTIKRMNEAVEDCAESQFNIEQLSLTEIANKEKNKTYKSHFNNAVFTETQEQNLILTKHEIR